MYQSYFSLQRHPFRITPDTSLFYSGGNSGRGVVLDAMLFAIESGEGILKVVGEVGSGKTMLCRMLEEQLPESTEVVYIANPNLTPDDILYAIAFELKLTVRRDTSKLLVMQQLQTYLLDQHSQNKKVLLVIEEAQGMPVETLEEIRLFSNLETHRDKLMQIILFGQPELDKNLSVKHIRQLRERITHSFYLAPLDVEEASEYIRFRLGAAGCPCPRLFSARAEWLIAKASGGLTRRINILADKAMLAAFAEDVLRLPEKLGPDVPPVIKTKHVLAAIRDSEYSLSIIDRLFSPLKVVSASVMAILVVVSLVLWPRTAGIASILPAADSVREANAGFAMELVEEFSPKLVEEELKSSESPIDVIASPESLGESVVPRDLPFSMPQLPIELSATSAMPTSVAFPNDEITEEPNPEPADLKVGVSANLARFKDSLDQQVLTRERVLQTRGWLDQVDTSGYTIQFLSGVSSNLSFAESFLGLMTELELLDESIVCISSEDSQSYWTIKHGSFSGLSVANRFIEQLPQHIRDFKPFVQNLNGIECNSNDSITEIMQERL